MTNQSDLLQMAFDAGWKTCADWLGRDDMHADIGSTAYERDRQAAIAAIRAGGAGEQPQPSHGDSTARAGDIGASDLPPLPEPDVRCGDYAGPPGEGANEDYYTAEQMHEYGAACVAFEAQRCAKVCSELAKPADTEAGHAYNRGVRDCDSAILAAMKGAKS